ncbi:MAG: NYN domain-containing protein [Gemmatimonadaceae bacterium]
MTRVRVYVDGFNFHYAIKAGGLLGLGWCDFRKLAERYLVGGDGEIDVIKYFTAHVRRYENRAGEERRQQTWLEAVKTIRGLEVIRGFHQQYGSKAREEKQTDINIAVELLVDAIDGACDRAILITGDIDQAPAVRAARERLPIGRRVEVDVWVPPGMSYERWRAEAKELGMVCREITPEMLAASRLADRIVTASGREVRCLEEWKMPTGLAGLRWRSLETDPDAS